jgi:hypothetical protein
MTTTMTPKKEHIVIMSQQYELLACVEFPRLTRPDLFDTAVKLKDFRGRIAYGHNHNQHLIPCTKEELVAMRQRAVDAIAMLDTILNLEET